MRHTAYIFDLDGVLVDTAELHYRAWRRLAHELGFELSIEQNEKLKGISRDESLSIILGIGGISAGPSERERLAARKNAWYVESLAGLGPTDALPGAIGFLHAAREADIRIALASASKNAPLILSALGMEGFFDAIVDGNSGCKPKPAPDIFLQAARLLNTPPASSVVFEDSAAGIEAALGGGFRAFGVGLPKNLPEAEVLVPGFKDLTPREIDRRLARVAEFHPRRDWLIIEHEVNTGSAAAHETRFTQANGHFALRGRSPFGVSASPACFVAGMYDGSSSPVSELAVLPDPSVIRLYMDHEAVDLQSPGLIHYQRVLDMEEGIVSSLCTYRAKSGAEAEICCQRFVSASEEGLWAERWTLRPLNFSRRIIVLSAIDGTLRNANSHPLEAAKHYRVRTSSGAGYGSGSEDTIFLDAQLLESGCCVSFVSTIMIPKGREGIATRAALREGVEQVEEAITIETEEGKELEFFRFGLVDATYNCTSDSDTGAQALRQRLKALCERGYAAALVDHSAVWAERWAHADVHISGDIEACRSLRFNLFHLMQAMPRCNEHVSIGAKGLHGEGYKGHVFWDTETFMLPFFLYTDPGAARRLLSYRWHTLAGARANAAADGYRGARFAWESARDGAETTPKWGIDYAGNPVRIYTGDEEVHIGADIAHAVYTYHASTGDDEFMSSQGYELVYSIAEFLESLALKDPTDGRRHIRRVIGTDEFHEHVDDDAFTNRLSAWTLTQAARMLHRESSTNDKGLASRLYAWGIGPDPEKRWAKAAEELVDPFFEAGDGIVEQFSGYCDLPDMPISSWDEHGMPQWPEGLDLARIGATQLLKQPDVVQVFAMLSEEFNHDFMLRNYNFYEKRTMHKSSLSPSIHAMVGVRLGETERAYDYFMKTVRTDLDDNQGNVGLGFHAASAGGAWQAAVFGFGGYSLVSSKDGDLLPSFDPWLPPHWTSLEYQVYWRGTPIRVSVRGSTVELFSEQPVRAMLRGTLGETGTTGFHPL
jgi:kojibiose phosphorylase